MTRLVFFDLDGTLIDNPSSEIKFFFFLLKKRYFGWRQIWASCMFVCRWVWHFKQEVFVKNKAYLSGLAVDDIAKLAEQFIRQKLLPNIRVHIKQRLDECIQNKDIVILLTGSPDFIANVFAEYLGVSEVYAARPALNADHFSSAPPLQHPYAVEKLKVAQMACDKYKVPISSAVAYANSIHDYELLNSCGTSSVVTPDKKLRRIAQVKNWPIID